MFQINSRSRRKKGQALAEMAVMAPFLVICMMGMLDLGRAFYYQIAITNAVREGARYAAQPHYYGLNPICSTIPPAPDPGTNCPAPGDQVIKDRVRQELNGTNITLLDGNIQVSPDQGARVTSYNGATPSSQYPLTVSANYQFNFITPIIGDLIGNPLTLRSSATMRSEY
jgi:Flp pilus assembly protein TadG